MFEGDALGETEVHDDREHEQHDHAEPQRIGALQLDDGDFVVATPQAPHFFFPFLMPSALMVVLGYGSPNRPCSRVVISRLGETLPAGALPIWATLAW